MRILLCNDDGIYAPALDSFAHSLRSLGQVTVVAPMEEKSTMGHSLTIHKPLRIQEYKKGFYAVNGSPADCIYMALRQIMDHKPDIILSGPNRGANLGQDVYYSGTVSAAREACILGIRSMSLSLDTHGVKPEAKLHFETLAKWLLKFMKSYDFKSLPKEVFLNVNAPNLPYSKIKGTRWTRQGFRYYSGTVLKRIDHRGRPYYWVGGQYKGFMNEQGTDCEAVSHGYISVTPVQLDTTDHSYLASQLHLEK